VRLGTACAIVVGEVVGVGIFLTPVEIIRAFASPIALAGLWIGMALFALTGALTLAELGARYPAVGGPYVYLREGLGPRAAFVYGWISLVVIDPGMLASLAIGFARYLGQIVALSPGMTKLAAITLLAAGTIVAASGRSISAQVLRSFFWAKLGVIALLVLAWLRAPVAPQATVVVTREGASTAAWVGAGIAAFFSFGGWWDLAKLTGELKEPARTLPRALVLGIAIVTLIYCLVTASFFHFVPRSEGVSSEAAVGVVARALLGGSGVVLLATTIIGCIAASVLAILVLAPRVYVAMARDGACFELLGRIHPGLGTPLWSTVTAGAIAALLVVLGSFDSILGYFVSVAILFLALTAAALFRIRRSSEAVPTYRVPAYPWLPIVFILFLVAFFSLMAIGRPRQVLIGIVVTSLGVPLYRVVAPRGPRQG
jgi:APA family basic amino acid/polyamine antiporter